MLFGEFSGERESLDLLDRAREGGISLLDTAEMYPVPPSGDTCGLSEKIVGKWLRSRRSSVPRNEVFLATKVSGPSGQMDWIRGGPPRVDSSAITKAVEGSLRRLQVDYLDLYQIHWPDRYVPMFGDTIYQHDRRFGSTSSSCSHRSVAAAGLEDQMEALQRLKDQGKVRCVGLSNETPWGLMKCCQLAKQNQSTTTTNNNNSSASASSEDIIGGGHHHHEGEGEKCDNKPKAKYAGVGYLQNAYNLLCRTFDTSGLSECCSEEDVGLLAYSPLAMGLLTGKYNKGNDFGGPPEARLNYYRGRYSEAEQRYERTTKVTEAVHLYADLALQCDMASPVELAIRFVLSHPNLASCIVGATTSAQLDEITRAAAKGPLPTEVLQQIDKIHTRNPNPAP